MKKIILILGFLFLAQGPIAGASQDIDFAKVELKIENVKDNIYVIFGPGGNIGVSIGEDGIILIDDQFAPLTPKIIKAIKTISDQSIRYVINTHWHPDHSGGNENLGKFGTLILAHDNVRDHLSQDWFYELFNETVPAAPKAALPVLTFSNEVSLHLNGDVARLIHIPHSHTDGDTVIYFERANIIHTGDAFIQQGYPLIDWSSGGTIDGMLEGFKTILALSDDNSLIIPGHGPISKRQDLAVYTDILTTIRDRVLNHINNELSEDEVVKLRPTAEWDEDYTNPYVTGESLTRAIYRTLKDGPDHDH